MRVLCFTHIHNSTSGLSPVSCERVDSLTYYWADKLSWNVDVLHNTNSIWRGPYKNQVESKCNIIALTLPVQQSGGIFRVLIKKAYKEGLTNVLQIILDRIRHRIVAYYDRFAPLQLTSNYLKAKKINKLLESKVDITNYDFLFCSIGYGDEYLFEYMRVFNSSIKRPMVIDYRDLFSGHHSPYRFSRFQKWRIAKYESRFIARSAVISVAQMNDAPLLSELLKRKVIHFEQGVSRAEDYNPKLIYKPCATVTYAGKLYSKGEGFQLFLDYAKEIANYQVKIQCFVDNPEELAQHCKEHNINNIDVNQWIPLRDLMNELCSSNVNLIYNSDISTNRQLLPTKAYNFAFCNRPLLFLYSYRDDAVVNFCQKVVAEFALDVKSAISFTLKHLDSVEETQVNRAIITREQAAENFTTYITKAIANF